MPGTNVSIRTAGLAVAFNAASALFSYGTVIGGVGVRLCHPVAAAASGGDGGARSWDGTVIGGVGIRRCLRAAGIGSSRDGR